jgi:16S rRNA (uracil1498-N3)-methyltransferase
MSSLYLREDLETVEPGGLVRLEGAEARHAVTVTRLRVGEAVSVGNGRGLIVTGVVALAAPGELVIEARETRRTPRPAPGIRLVQALAKGGRDEMAVQAATELGVDAITPWAAARSVSRWEGPKIERGRERWASIVREACKQSIRAWLPEVGPLESTHDIARRAARQRVLVLEPDADVPLSGIGADARDIVLVVGPEGGFSEGELRSLLAAGAEPVRLGEGVLRTSTAGPAAIAVLNVALGRW